MMPKVMEMAKSGVPLKKVRCFWRFRGTRRSTIFLYVGDDRGSTPMRHRQERHGVLRRLRHAHVGKVSR